MMYTSTRSTEGMIHMTPIIATDLAATLMLDRDDIADLRATRDAIELAWHLIDIEPDTSTLLEVDLDQLADIMTTMILSPMNN
jgi:hypothetical protein